MAHVQMARIRTVKPRFFRHVGLFNAEKETGLPIRLAFAGLWTACDREGRFVWIPEELKLDCLPHDDVDFSRVLDALATRCFIRRYTVAGVTYGCVPSWHDHQVINNREAASVLPPPPETVDVAGELTRAPRVADACPTRHGNYKAEGEGEEEEEGKEDTGTVEVERAPPPTMPPIPDFLRRSKPPPAEPPAQAPPMPQPGARSVADVVQRFAKARDAKAQRRDLDPEARKARWQQKVFAYAKTTLSDREYQLLVTQAADGSIEGRAWMNRLSDEMRAQEAEAERRASK